MRKEHRIISEKTTRLNSSQGPSVEIRRATRDDIESLVKICRENLPGFMMWCTSRRARQWWEHVITSTCHETWIGQIDNEIVALIRLVTDADQYWKEIEKFKPGLGAVLLVLSGRPRLLFAKMWERIARAVAGSENYCDGDGLDNFVNRSAWTHSIVVVEKMRGRGIASEMIRFCERRAAEIGYDSVKCFIKTDNRISIRLHERLGFVRVKKVRDHYLYVRLLCKDHSEQTVFPGLR
ncbi:MAG: GNAT family N-acetyltransferase [Planctomycetota bacterium]